MFTGLIETQGQILKIDRKTSLYQLEIKATKLFDDLKLGDSVATNGVCLTVSDLKRDSFVADVMPKTLEMTNLAKLKVRSMVNLERALTLEGRVGGHLVTGHIDGIARLKGIQADENAFKYVFSAEPSLMSRLMPQGSIAIDGISLTLAEVGFQSFMVSVIPHTLKETTLGSLKVGEFVNIETDVIGKYIQHFMKRGGETSCMSSAALTAFLMD